MAVYLHLTSASGLRQLSRPGGLLLTIADCRTTEQDLRIPYAESVLSIKASTRRGHLHTYCGRNQTGLSPDAGQICVRPGSKTIPNTPHPPSSARRACHLGRSKRCRRSDTNVAAFVSRPRGERPYAICHDTAKSRNAHHPCRLAARQQTRISALCRHADS